jgi:hypothetical protein
MNTPALARRGFLQLSAGSVGALGVGSSRSVSLVTEPEDAVASSLPVIGATQELESALSGHGITLRRFQSVSESPLADFCIVIAAATVPRAAAALHKAALRMPPARESLVLTASSFEGRPGVLACGSDARGLMYALLELADRVRHAQDPLEGQGLQMPMPIVEQPCNQVRSIGRLFVSEVEDKPWFNGSTRGQLCVLEDRI